MKGAREFSAALTPFARAILAVAALVILGISLTIARGDRVGVRLVRAEPEGETHSDGSILLQFSAEMERASVEERLRLQPSVAGEWRWNGSVLRFHPALPFPPGETYRLSLAAGARSRWGRAMLVETTLEFWVRQPRVLWLGPADKPPYQLYYADTDDLDNAQPLTDLAAGVYDFAVSPDGQQVVYSAASAPGEPHELYLLEVATGASTLLTQCALEDADCTRPAWRPGRRELAYERVELNRQIADVSASPTRVWLLDLTGAPRTRPLFADNQQLGHSAQWSADGRALAVFDPSYPEAGIVVVRMDGEKDSQFIPTNSGSVGALSPDGTLLFFPEIHVLGNRVRTILRQAELAKGLITDFTPADLAVDDTLAAWHPDGRQLLLARRYDGDRWTHSPQLYLLDTETNALQTLVFDGHYNVSDFSFDAAGTMVLMHRFPLLDEEGRYNNSGVPEIWLYELATGELRRLAVNGFHPRWLP